jgi:hypothetical protein
MTSSRFGAGEGIGDLVLNHFQVVSPKVLGIPFAWG